MPTVDPVAAFTAFMIERGVRPLEPIIASGELERSRVDGDNPRKRNLSYQLHADGVPNGWFIHWSSGIADEWIGRSNGRPHSAESGAQIDQLERQNDRLLEAREHAKQEAQRRWVAALDARADHPYLRAKGIGAHNIKQLGNELLVPVRDERFELIGLQRIFPSGNKCFLRGTPVPGHFFVIGTLAEAPVILIAEGYATAATLHEAAGLPVVVTFGSNNLVAVARTIRSIYTTAQIIIAGDDDRAVPFNPGRTKAQEAAHAISVRYVLPEFEEGEDGSDFNDLARHRGLDAVRAALQAAHARADDPAMPQGSGALDTAHGARGGEFTDTGNAARLVAMHGERIRYVPKWGTWLVWDGVRWLTDDRAVHVAELAKDIGRELMRQAADNDDERRAKWGAACLNVSKIRAMVELARGIDGVIVQPDDLDRDGWLLGVRNGVIDLRTGTLRRADPADLMTKQAPVEYDPDASAPRWERALSEWFPDADVRDYVQRLVGAALVGEQRDHVFVIHYGAGRNGKGTFVRALFSVLGPYAVVPHLSLLVQTRNAEHDTVKAVLFRARLAVASETERRVKLAEASVKNLTGRDRITCRRMHENPWEFTPGHSLWLQTNYLPEIAGRDAGVWSRIRVVPWLATFDRREDHGLDDALAAEAPGILRWAVEGCIAWQARGLEMPEAVIRATLEYQRAEDKLLRFAQDSGLQFGDGLRVPETALKRVFREWMESEGVRIDARQFNDWMKENGASRRRVRVEDARPWFWEGVGIGLDGRPDEGCPQRPQPVRLFPRSASREENPDDLGTLGPQAGNDAEEPEW